MCGGGLEALVQGATECTRCEPGNACCQQEPYESEIYHARIWALSGEREELDLGDPFRGPFCKHRIF